MSWVTIIWSMVASACLTLAGIYLLVWCKKRTAWASLLFSLTAVATAAMAFCELWMMRAETPGQFGTALRWLHVPAFVIIVSLIGFVLFHLRAGRPWLAWTICALRTFSLLLNFLTGQNLNYREVTGLRHIPFLGESVSVAEGVSNPWMLVGQLSLLLFVVFVTDAAITVWRRGDRRPALVTGGSIVFCVLAGTVQAVLVLWQIVHWPITASFFYLAIVAAMGYEMSREALRAAQLSDDLRESEERMTLATEAAGFGVWTWDIARDVIWVTDKTRALFGFTKSERIDLNQFLLKLHPDDREPVTHAVAKSMNGDGEYESEHRVVLPDRPVRWIASRGRVEFNGAGKPVFLRGVSLDITARKQAEEALRESESRFRTMANTAPVLIWMSGTDQLCNFFNKGWLDFTGRTLEQELGNGWAEGVHREDLDRCLDVYTNSFNSRQEFTLEYRLRRRDGEYGWVLDTGVPRFAPDGTFLGYIGSCIDITGRKQTELEIAQQRNELAHLSRVTMLGELSGSLAHELNQPLTAILSNAQAALRFLAHDNADLNEVRDILADIVDEDKRAGEVIRRLRLLLKKGEAEHQPFDLNEVVREVLKLVRSDLVNQGVAVHTELAPALPAVNADRVQLQQVLLNLVMNACDAMAGGPAGDHKLIIRTGLAGGEGIRVSVADRGVGLASDKLEKVFEPFFTTKVHGMGLGLSVCRTIITAHGGKLWAANNPERGATFYFTLPVSEEGQGASEKL
jgi:two-component system sensor kinase FixL